MEAIPNSYPNIPRDKALKLIHDLSKIFYESGIDGDVVTLHKAGKQLTSLFYDCKSARHELSQHLIDLQFIEIAVNVMKHLNNIGVFQSDNIWYSSFYLYNIFWKYSEVNPAFASGLITCGIHHLLISNIMHYPCIEDLSKDNANDLIKRTLRIVHNILRGLGNRPFFSYDRIIKELLKIAAKDDNLAVLSTLCLSFIAANDNIKNIFDSDINNNMKLIFHYIKTATESGGKYKGYSRYKFFEALKFASLSTIQRDAIINLDGINVMIRQLKSTNDERIIREILITLVNLYDNNSKSRIKEISEYYLPNASSMVSSAAKTLAWAMAVGERNAEENENSSTHGNKIFINFAQRDFEIAKRIFKELGNLEKLSFLSCKDDIDMLKQSFAEASIVIMCISEAFRRITQFKIGFEYCLWKKKVVLPVLVQSNYKLEGRVKDFVGQAFNVCYDFSNNIHENWDKFIVDLQIQLNTLKV